ncbi:ABC transporter ATP-binding protein [bacterium]|nr:MAG: ABC transporter ATP-binding protein [bacterium]
MQVSPDILIKAQGVSFRYRDEPILSDINFEVNRGDYVGVIGPNGGGKTTLLKIIVGLVKPQSGRIFLFGQALAAFKDWPKIGYVPQKAASFENRFPISAREVVEQGRVSKRGMFRRLGREDRAAVDKALDMVGMREMGKNLITELSGGEQQKVFIARSLASEPELLILDEPTVGVDAESQRIFFELLANLNKKYGLTLVLVSHDVDVVVSETSKLLCVNEKMVYHGSPKLFEARDYLKGLYGKDRKFVIHGN